jgi:fructose-1,6-bisphosphatase/inositol monophosphatase family enzyme
VTRISHFDAIADLFDGFDARAMAAFRQVETHIKADGTPVTRVDRETTEAVQTALQARFPSYGILSEENPVDYLPGAEWQWVMDPLDGTAMFARGFPVWGLGIGLMRGHEPVEGYLSFPVLRERYTCWKGEIRINGRLLPESPDAPPAPTRNILVGSDIIQAFPLHRMRGYKMRNFGTNLYHLIAVGLGHAEAMISPRSFLWDLVPALPFTRARGMVERYLDGSKFDLTPLWEPARRHEAMPLPLVVGTAEAVKTVLSVLG